MSRTLEFAKIGGGRSVCLGDFFFENLYAGVSRRSPYSSFYCYITFFFFFCENLYAYKANKKVMCCLLLCCLL